MAAKGRRGPRGELDEDDDSRRMTASREAGVGEDVEEARSQLPAGAIHLGRLKTASIRRQSGARVQSPR